jgi:hypothetical protein
MVNKDLLILLIKQDTSDANLDFAQEVGKFPVTDFSVVDLRLEAMGHAYGATLLHLLHALPVQNAIKTLRVTLLSSENSEVTLRCVLHIIQLSSVIPRGS